MSEEKQANCPHDHFTYDEDTDVTYCDDCDASIWCGDLMKELMEDLTGDHYCDDGLEGMDYEQREDF